MKMFSKTEDGEIDCMLRAQIGRRSELGSVCREFDPDYASAFVEHSLTPGEQSLYESHLAACHPCRSGVIALARLADADRERAHVEPARARAAGLMAGVAGWFGAFGFRQLVPAAVAFLVVAVSLPLLLLRKDSPLPEAPAVSESKTAQGQAAQTEMKDNAGVTARAKDDAGTQMARAAALRSSALPATDDLVTAPAAPAREVAKEEGGRAVADQPAPAAPPPTERVESTMVAEESSRNVSSVVQLPSAPSDPAPAPEAAESKLARIDETNSLRLPGDSRGSAEMIVVKPGVYSGRQSSGRITTATITPKDSIAPPSSSSSDAMRRGLAKRNPEAESRARSSSEAARLRGTASRKINSKTFWLVKGVWTDSKYNPDREQAEITVVRDGDIYADLLVKHTGLKVFFNAFPSDERVTVVYKDTVYKLMPPTKE